MNELAVSEAAGALHLRVWVKPRASRTAVVGLREGALEIAVAAPPVDGEANAELVAFLARKLGIAKRAVSVVSGQTGRNKLVAIMGVSAEALRATLLASLR